MMKPPISASFPSGTPAQQFMHRARMFRNAAGDLVANSNGEQFLPKYALLTHAIELSLKAFALHSVSTGNHRKHQSVARTPFYTLPAVPRCTGTGISGA